MIHLRMWKKRERERGHEERDDEAEKKNHQINSASLNKRV